MLVGTHEAQDSVPTDHVCSISAILVAVRQKGRLSRTLLSDLNGGNLLNVRRSISYASCAGGCPMILCHYRTIRFPLLAIGLAVLLVLGTLGPCPVARAATRTVVSITFDDSDEDQYTNALPALESHGMHATFYAITGYVGVNSGYLTVPQLQAMYNAGNE